MINDKPSFHCANYVSAARAQELEEAVRMRFPNKVTIGAILPIRDLVKKQLRGAIQRPLVVASRHIPCHGVLPSIPSARLQLYARRVGGAANSTMHLREPAPSVLTSR